MNLAKHNSIKDDAKFIGIDVEKDMIDYAKKKNKNSGLEKNNVDFLCGDATLIDLKKNDFLISYFTIQFIHPKNRQNLINKIYESLNWGGAFLFFGKVRYNDARFQDIFTTLYTDYKLDMGYSHEEIINKTRSLKGVMEPFSTEGNLGMLKELDLQISLLF